LNTSDSQKEWRDKFQPILAQAEDLFVPVSEDVDVMMEKMGGEPDIKAIVDIDLLTNQLLGALRTSKSMLGITDDLPGSIGEGAANRISINFAKSAERLQSGTRQGIKRLCQIHLAYRKLNPDPSRFEVNFADISSAEEEELKNALSSGMDVVEKLMDVYTKAVPDIDKMELLDYCNRRILKLNDLDFQKLRTKLAAAGVAGLGTIGDAKKDVKNVQKIREFMLSSDCMSYLPDVTAEENIRKELDESLKILISKNDSELTAEELSLKHRITDSKRASIFRIDEADMTLKKESAIWQPRKINFDFSKSEKRNGTGNGNK
jgi:hypothetical protein